MPSANRNNMRRRLLLIGLFLLLVGCSPAQETRAPTATSVTALNASPESATETAPPTAQPTASQAPSPSPSTAPTETAAPTSTAPPTETAAPPPTAAIPDEQESSAGGSPDLALDAAGISLFPVPDIFEGDLVSIQLGPTIPKGLPPNDVDVQILLDDEALTGGNLNWRNLNGDALGMYQWVWDTADQGGVHTITAILDPNDTIQVGDENPDNNEATVSVTIRPRSELPPRAVDATWIQAENSCCTVHVVTGTAAHRDLDQLLVEVDQAFEVASERLDEPLSGPYDVFFADRVIGQGGYATDVMVVSYLDRDYSGGGLHEVLVHEAVHLIDRAFAPNHLTFLSEGVAVWATGGHYHQEDVGQRMRALLELELYIPVEKVIDDFYAMQHEIAYLEAASFIDYLVKTYGWSQVRVFYGESTGDDGPTQSAAIDANLQRHFGKTLQEVEAEWLAYIDGLPRDRQLLADLQNDIHFYNAVRRYQQAFDPTAYYLNAWLPSPKEAEQRGATADLTRRPNSETNVALETMLDEAAAANHDGDPERASGLVDSVLRVIGNDGQFLDPLARAHMEIVETAAELGYEVQQINLIGNRAIAAVSTPKKMRLTELQFALTNDLSWVLIR